MTIYANAISGRSTQSETSTASGHTKRRDGTPIENSGRHRRGTEFVGAMQYGNDTAIVSEGYRFVSKHRNLRHTPSESEAGKKHARAEDFETAETALEDQLPYTPIPAADRTNNDRIELISRSYRPVGLTKEESARLEILSQRVSRLFPSVTAEEEDELASVVQMLEDGKQQLSIIAKRHNLRD